MAENRKYMHVYIKNIYIYIYKLIFCIFYEWLKCVKVSFCYCIFYKCDMDILMWCVYIHILYLILIWFITIKTKLLSSEYDLFNTLLNACGLKSQHNLIR